MAIENLESIFTYPYNNDLLMRKQKSIRRQLLARNSISYVDKRIAILSGSTTDDVKNILELFLLYAGIKPVFYQSEYNKFYEDAVWGNPELDEFKPEIIIIFTSMVNILNVPQLGDSAETVQEKLQEEAVRFNQVWEALRDRYHAVIIQNNMDMPYEEPLGSLGAVKDYGLSNFIEKLNMEMAVNVKKCSGVYIHDLHRLSAKIGLDKWHNRFQFYAYKLAMDYDVIPMVANSLGILIKAVLGKSKKCLVLDLDNTLWGGIIGDDGVENIKIGHETPEAEAFSAFQEYVSALKKRGIILAVCSKNDEVLAKSGFEHPDSVLKADDFIAFYANWHPKNVNIRAIAEEINIGLDSLVFIDDNPAERQIVRESFPEVAVPEVNPQDVFSYIRAIEGAGYFEAVEISADDMKRNESYMQNKQRKALEVAVGDYDDFLRSLEMKAEIGSFKPVYFDRIAQLTNKSNQFNLTTCRYTRADIERISSDNNYITLYARLADKFGDNGLIAVVIGEKKENELHIILWLMSCRVLKRGVEYVMLDELVRIARVNGCRDLVGYYYKTKKNGMAADLYKMFGFSLVATNGDDTVWKLGTDNYVNQGKDICLQGESV